MKTNVFTVFISLMALISCRSPQQTVIPTEKIETKVERVIEVRWDTAYIEVQAQSAEITTPDSVSHLETDFATSDARINPDGTLFHNLLNKPQERPTVVPTTIQRVDSIVEREVPVVVYKNKPPNNWEQFKIDSFWWLIGTMAALFVINFRKPILSLIKKIL